MSIDAVMSRIGEIQSTLDNLNGIRASVANTTSTGTTPTTTAATPWKSLPSTTATSFAAALAKQTSTTSNKPLGEQAVEIGKQYLGVPYKYGGTDPKTGLDCSGLTQLVYKQLGITLPRTAAQQGKAGVAVPSLDQAKPGDLIVFNGGSHVGIYVGDGQLLNAPSSGKTVRIAPVKYYGTISAIRRVTPPEQTTNATTVSATATAGTSGLSTYQTMFGQATAKYGLPQGLLAAVAQVESGGNARAVSPVGAQGLMQLMPKTAAGLGVNAFIPGEAIDGAARLLRSNLDQFGSLPLAIAAYNAGAGAVKRYGGIPPYAETQQYVKKVTALMNGASA